MRRLFLILALFGMVFAHSFVDVQASQTDPATAELASQVKKTVKVWTGRMSREDRRAYDMMTDELKQIFFGGVTDATTQSQLFENTFFDITIHDVAGIQATSDTQIEALVSLSGFQDLRGYRTFRFIFRDDGGEYLTITGISQTDIYFPGEATPAVADLVITLPVDDTLLEVSLDESEFLLIVFDNQDQISDFHAFLLYEEGTDPTNQANVLTSKGIRQGQVAQMGIAGLPAGRYVLVDISNLREISLIIQ